MNRVENAQLKPVNEMEKLEKASTDIVINDNAKIAFLRWKDKKVVTVISSKYGLNPTAKTDIEQPHYIKKCNQGRSGVDLLKYNIATYMIAHKINCGG